MNVTGGAAEYIGLDTVIKKQNKTEWSICFMNQRQFWQSKQEKQVAEKYVYSCLVTVETMYTFLPIESLITG